MIGIKSEAVLLYRKFITSKTLAQRIRNIHPKKVLSDSEGEDVKKIKKLTKEMKEINKYFEHSDFASNRDKLPSRIVKVRKSCPPHLYLLDYKTADIIVDMIKDDLIADSDKVIEANPGTGILTRKLLDAGVPYVTAMEPCADLIRYLAELQTTYPNRMTIRNSDMLTIWKIAHQDKQDGGSRVADLFADFSRVKWGEEIGLRIIGAVTNWLFIKCVILDIVRQCGLASYGRPCFYMSMPPLTWMRLSSDKTACKSHYRSLTVLFQLLFDYKLLCKIPRKAYLPWLKNPPKLKRASAKSSLNNDDMYLVKFEGKKNLFTDIIAPEHIQPLWHFVNQHMVSRSARVIPRMEAWQPDCGPNLIMQDMNIFTEFGDLSPQQILHLFKEFMSWDGYRNSFIPSMENSLQKMEQLVF